MIVNDEIDGRMLRLIEQYYAAGYAMTYRPDANRLIFEWGRWDKCVCQLDAWFTPEAQDYIIDLIYPRL